MKHGRGAFHRQSSVFGGNIASISISGTMVATSRTYHHDERDKDKDNENKDRSKRDDEDDVTTELAVR